MEEHFDIQMFAKAKLDFNQRDRAWLLYQGEYVPFRREWTCRNTSDWFFECSRCGASIWADSCGEFSPDIWVEKGELRFCPNCGAKVVE